MDIDQIQADGYEFGMDLAFGILEENENNPARRVRYSEICEQTV